MAQLGKARWAGEAPRAPVQLVTFEVDGGIYALDIRVVKEINPAARLTAVPRAPAHVRGLVNLRGQVVLVLDLAVMLGRTPDAESTQVVILKTGSEVGHTRAPYDAGPFGDKPLALLVSQLGDVLTVAADRVVPAPSHVPEARARHIEGVVEQADHLLVILDPCALLTQEDAGKTERRDG